MSDEIHIVSCLAVDCDAPSMYAHSASKLPTSRVVCGQDSNSCRTLTPLPPCQPMVQFSSVALLILHQLHYFSPHKMSTESLEWIQIKHESSSDRLQSTTRCQVSPWGSWQLHAPAISHGQLRCCIVTTTRNAEAPFPKQHFVTWRRNTHAAVLAQADHHVAHVLPVKHQAICHRGGMVALAIAITVGSQSTEEMIVLSTCRDKQRFTALRYTPHT